MVTRPTSRVSSCSFNESPVREPLVGDRFQHHRIALIARDSAVKALEVVGPADGHAQFLDLVRAGVAYHASAYFGLGVVAGEAVVGVDGWWHVVDFVAGGNGDLKGIDVAVGLVEFEGKLARLLALKEVKALVSEYARPDQQQSAGVFGIVIGFEGVVKAEGQVGLLQVDHGGVGDVKTGKRIAE